MLINFIEKHCQECPKFASEFDQLSKDMTQKTLQNLHLTSPSEPHMTMFSAPSSQHTPTQHNESCKHEHGAVQSRKLNNSKSTN